MVLSSVQLRSAKTNWVWHKWAGSLVMKRSCTEPCCNQKLHRRAEAWPLLPAELLPLVAEVQTDTQTARVCRRFCHRSSHSVKNPPSSSLQIRPVLSGYLMQLHFRPRSPHLVKPRSTLFSNKLNGYSLTNKEQQSTGSPAAYN